MLHYMLVYIDWAAGHRVKIVLLLMTVITVVKSVDYTIHVNCIEGIQCELKNVIPILKMFVTLTLMVSTVPIVTQINVINEKIITLL